MTQIMRGITEGTTKPWKHRPTPELVFYVHLKDRGRPCNIKIHVGVEVIPEKVAAGLCRAIRLRKFYEFDPKNFSLEVMRAQDVFEVFWFSKNGAGSICGATSKEEAQEIGEEWLRALHHRADCRFEVA